MSEYRPLAKEISQVYSKHKNSISFDEYKFLLVSIVNILQLPTIKDLPPIAADVL